jgi:hypothetical protein
LDCRCHERSADRAEADVFEQELRELPPLRVPVSVADALTPKVFERSLQVWMHQPQGMIGSDL